MKPYNNGNRYARSCPCCPTKQRLLTSSYGKKRKRDASDSIHRRCRKSARQYLKKETIKQEIDETL